AAALWPRLRNLPGSGGRLTYTLDGKPTSDIEHPVGLVGAAGAASAAGDEAAAHDLLARAADLDRRHPTYFGAAWVALGEVTLSRGNMTAAVATMPLSSELISTMSLAAEEVTTSTTAAPSTTSTARPSSTTSTRPPTTTTTADSAPGDEGQIPATTTTTADTTGVLPSGPPADGVAPTPPGALSGAPPQAGRLLQSPSARGPGADEGRDPVRTGLMAGAAGVAGGLGGLLGLRDRRRLRPAK
ncbi:MAG: hypothetical protein M3357_20045, partial [Actinomycetota bacterium]|nr:hypothetical protein [Actinomycetota bacterium]